MKKTLVILFIMLLSCSLASPVFASDWDKAGKVLTVIEGLRLITGGEVDVIGSVSGIKHKRDYGYYNRHHKKSRRQHRIHSRAKQQKHSYYHARKFDCPQRIWVPHYEWKREYIPRSEKTSSTFGKIIVEGHYIEYKVEKGGHWETKYFCK